MVPIVVASVIDRLVWHQCRDANDDCRLAGVDVGQTIGSRMRKTVGVEKDKSLTIAPTMLPQQEFWLSKVSGNPFHRWLLGVEALQLQSWRILTSTTTSLTTPSRSPAR